jgi:hypothetical protein
MADNHRRAGRRFRAAGEYVRAGLRQRRARDLLRAAGLVLGERWMSKFARRREAAQPPPDWIGQALSEHGAAIAK